MPKYLVEALSQYRMVYVIEAETEESAQDTITMDNVNEFGQMHLGEMILSSREVTDGECVRVHDELNEYLSDWTDEMKLSRVYKVNV